jgi:hypothetical protein
MRSPRSGRALAVALVGALVVVLAVVILVLSDRDRHIAGTNNVFDRTAVADLQLGDELCERFETVPADAAAVRFSVEPGPAAHGGALVVRILDGAGVVTRGERRGSWTGGSVDVPIAHVPDTLTEAQVCVRNRGESTLTHRGHGVTPKRLGFTLRGEQWEREVRLAYLRAGRESWWSVATAVAHRFGLGRGELFGGWLAYAWLLCVLATGGVTVALVMREWRA